MTPSPRTPRRHPEPSSFLDPGAMEAIRGGTLFYPASGQDLAGPLAAFLSHIDDFWFVDRGYFVHRGADRGHPVSLRQAGFRFEGCEIEGPPLSVEERRVDERGRPYPYIQPCTRTDRYREVDSGRMVRIRRRRGFGQRSIELVPRIHVFFHRGDSPGEGGSGLAWWSRRWKDLVLDRLVDGGLVVTDGSLCPGPLARFHRADTPPDEAFRLSKPFTRWGRLWTPVGWLEARYGPTLVWRVEAVGTE